MARVEFSVSGSIGRITFNRPEALNALNLETLAAFGEILSEVEKRDDLRVLILTGAGEKAFIAGADILEMSAMTPIDAAKFAKTGQSLLFVLERLQTVSIAAVNGFALGGGCELAMACDLIYASERARFGQPEVNLGVIPGFGGTQRLARLVGPMRARRMIYTGEMIDAREAERIGLAAGVFPQETLMAEVEKVAETILSKGSEAVRRAKVAIREGYNADLTRGCMIEKDEFALCFAHPTQKEGMAAFLEKRKPNWR